MRFGRCIVAALLLVSAAACAGPGRAGSERVTYRASDFRSGEAVSLAELRGRPVLMTSWATWCTECRTELPALQRFWKEHRGTDLAVVAVNVDGGGGGRLARAMVEEFGLTMDLWVDSDGTFSSTFLALGVPATALVSADGALVRTWQGGADFADPELVGAVGRALGGDAS